MTIEELREEATSTVEWESTPMIDRPLFVLAYTKGAEPREKRIAQLEKENTELQAEIIKVCDANKELESQIEKIKTRIKEIVFSNDFVNSSPHQNLEHKVRALCNFYKEMKEDIKSF